MVDHDAPDPLTLGKALVGMALAFAAWMLPVGLLFLTAAAGAVVTLAALLAIVLVLGVLLWRVG